MLRSGNKSIRVKEVAMQRGICVLTIAGMIALAFLASSGLSAAAAGTSKTLDREADPAVIPGSLLAGLNGAPLNQLFVYAFRSGQWHQIPWQFDEVRNLEYLAFDNGLLDPADELVVMGRDCGDQAAAKEWINDDASRSFPRYEIMIVDPLDSGKKGWIYLYRSATLTDTVKTDYVDFDFPSSLFTSPVYKLGLMVKYIAGDRLELNGSGVDLLDRSKYRFKPATQEVFTEEWAEGEDPQPEVLDGRVRAIAGYQEKGQGLLTIAYRSQFYDLITVDLSWAPLSLEWAQASADFNDKIAPGIYYDAHTPLGVPVDGIPDAVAAAPAELWQQISSATGTIIHTADVSPMQGTTALYYRDSAIADPHDTGDHVSYGEMGVTVSHPINYLYLSVTHYILPPHMPNVGATYFQYFGHPLQVEVRFTRVEDATEPTAPAMFALSDNYPNPFNASTAMRYQTGTAGAVEIALYDLAGRRICTLEHGEQSAGEHEVQWDGRDDAGNPAPSGLYFCRMQAGTFAATRRWMLLR